MGYKAGIARSQAFPWPVLAGPFTALAASQALLCKEEFQH